MISGFQIAATLIGGLVGFLLIVATFALVLSFISSTFRGLVGRFVSYMEDYTTGFLKVRERVMAQSKESIWTLAQHNPIGEFADYPLEIGKTDAGGFGQTVVIPGDYRPTHMYVVGASGSGKSSLLKNFLVQDIKNRMGFCVIDPHG